MSYTKNESKYSTVQLTPKCLYNAKFKAICKGGVQVKFQGMLEV